jgi:hypothetical protein
MAFDFPMAQVLQGCRAQIRPLDLHVYGAPFPMRDQVRYAILVRLHQLHDIPTMRLQFLDDLTLDGTFQHHSLAS